VELFLLFEGFCEREVGKLGVIGHLLSPTVSEADNEPTIMVK